ncbi:hypothetical protein [Allokutzneria sp. NRRL B-24872]|uniref:hypothetical protein n=1 Tax=Allokutzneria sp. NRRL B-24872 TaxID=1137961 RepID=UPI000A3B5FB6|nr:hypothetical protein [Allokutzneria sp. NRRL B-24872]
MSEFSATVRDQIAERLTALSAARAAGHDYEVHLHGARVRDLLDLAVRNDVDVTGWVDPAVLDAATLDG